MTDPALQKIIDDAHKPPECSRITVERRGEDVRIRLFDRGGYQLYDSGWTRLADGDTLNVEIGENP